MRLITLGTGTAAPLPMRVNAGHLVESGSVRLLLDCGSGVAHRMATLGVDWVGITHVALTHFHADHILDLPTLFVAWRYGTMRPRTAPLEVIGPAGTARLLSTFAALFGEPVGQPQFPLSVRELAPGGVLDLGNGVRLEAYPVPHAADSIAYCISVGTRRIVYTGDTGEDAGLAAWAQGCDLLLAECSLPDEIAVPAHLSPRRCAELAAAAQPARLVLTHMFPPVEAVNVRAIVGLRYGGPVVLASDGWTFDIEDS